MGANLLAYGKKVVGLEGEVIAGDVSVNVSSTDTWRQALNRLYSVLDTSKITNNACIIASGHIFRKNTSSSYSEVYVGTAQYVATTIGLSESSSYYYQFGSNSGRQDLSTNAIGFSGSISLCY